MSARRSNAGKTTARARARQRRVLLDAGRAARDEAIEEAGSKFFELSDAREKFREKIAAIETEMAAPIARLVELGEPQRRIAQLLDVTVEEIKQLRVADKPKDGEPSDAGS